MAKLFNRNHLILLSKQQQWLQNNDAFPSSRQWASNTFADLVPVWNCVSVRQNTHHSCRHTHSCNGMIKSARTDAFDLLRWPPDFQMFPVFLTNTANATHPNTSNTFSLVSRRCRLVVFFMTNHVTLFLHNLPKHPKSNLTPTFLQWHHSDGHVFIRGAYLW